MPSKCYVLNCNPALRPLRRFPLFSKMSEFWIQRIANPNLVNKSHKTIYECYGVCSRHFIPQCVTVGNNKLHKFAVPSVMIPGFNEEPRLCNSFKIYGESKFLQTELGIAYLNDCSAAGVTIRELNVEEDTQFLEDLEDLEVSSTCDETTIFDFTRNAINEGWTEKSDTIRQGGMSKAVISIQKTQIFQRAVLFTLLNPQANGICFAGVQNITTLNLKDYNNLLIRVRGQGENFNYKIILSHKNLNQESFPTYEQFFTLVPNEFQDVILPFSAFYAYYRGKEVKNAEPLDKSQITSIGIQIYGSNYLPVKQTGVSSLEINWIKAIN